MSLINAEREINEGIASVTAALGEPPAPFLRIPGLARTNAIDHYLASQNLLTWSADFPADDWTRISPTQVYTRALQRIEANGKGILLLHDIQARTVEALPDLLHKLKRRGYRIIHVTPATPERPKDRYRAEPVDRACTRTPDLRAKPPSVTTSLLITSGSSGANSAARAPCAAPRPSSTAI
jgi:peptidoglycan/xylan/chitin deacetylase (PgdA/CDA1 family)